MNDGPYREASPIPGEDTHCLFCGSRRDDATGVCVKCGAWTASSAHDPSPSTGFPCPRCKSPLAAQSFGRANVKACAECFGLFCPALQFSLLLNDYLANVDLPLGDLKMPPPGKQPQIVPFVHCIVCAQPMDRVNFASRSNAIVDVCTQHGVWLDAGELVPILHFVKTRAELGEVPLTIDEKLDRIKLDRETAASNVRVQNYDATIQILIANRFDSDGSDDNST